METFIEPMVYLDLGTSIPDEIVDFLLWKSPSTEVDIIDWSRLDVHSTFFTEIAWKCVHMFTSARLDTQVRLVLLR